jgi:hypothetical protein
MTRAVVGFLGLLILLSALQAGDKSETPTPAEQYQKLEKEYQTALTELRKAYEEAKTQQDKQKVLQEKHPRDKYAQRFLELAEKNPKDPAAVDALVWILTHGGGGNQRPKAIQLLLRDHIQSEKMASLCPTLGRVQDEESHKLLHAVLEKNKHRPAQAQACLALAQQIETKIRLARRLKDDPDLAKRYEALRGKEAVETLVKADPDKMSKEAEAYYERIVTDFADTTDAQGTKLGDMAKRKLDALRNPIVVGKPAPEIEAEDIDGKKFKLSDYRGKVVLLDFWGHW